MSKNLLAITTLAGALTLSGGALAATGLQLDPTGAFGAGGSVTLQNLGGEAGHFLCHECVTAPRSGTIYMMQSYTTSVGRISYQLGIPVDSSTTLAGAGLKLVNSGGTDDYDGASFFNLYFDPADTFNPATDHLAGANFDAGTLIASGSARLALSANTVTLIQDTDKAGNIDIDGAGGNSTLGIDLLSGAISVDVDITDQNQGDTLGFILNDLVNADLTDFIDTALFGGGIDLPYPDPVPGIHASTKFNDGTTDFSPSFGPANADGGVNDFAGGAVPFDFQAQVSAEMNFAATLVPEPTTVGLLGLGLGLAGFSASRRKKA